MILAVKRRLSLRIRSSIDRINIEKQTLGNALRKNLRVDVNQREYSWLRKQIDELYGDFEEVIRKGKSEEHFLGTIVATDDEDGHPKVVDGQQRLATTMILLAAIRDYYYVLPSERERSFQIETLYLQAVDPDTMKPVPHLRLNAVDNEYFFTRILLRPDDSTRNAVRPTRESHKRILEAAERAEEKIRFLTNGNTQPEAIANLITWRKFIEERARVIWVSVPDDNTAYIIFETMNDRGVRLSASDLLDSRGVG